MLTGPINGRIARLGAALLLGVLVSEPAAADVIVIEGSIVLIGPDDRSYDGHDLIIRGGQVTIDGAHAFASLTLEGAAFVTHSPRGTVLSPGEPPVGMIIVIAGSLSIDAASRIDVNDRGYEPAHGPGAGCSGATRGTGGGHGGRGEGPPPCGNAYETAPVPTELGSGGGNDGPHPGGSGGGSVRLVIGGIAVIDGSVSADGGNAGSAGASSAGGGSGGSVWITAAAIAGEGAVSARGGSRARAGGHGGGGRVSLEACEFDFPCDHISVAANATAQPGTVHTPLDYDADGVLNSSDFFAYLQAFFAGEPAADFNCDSLANSQDFFDYLSAFFAGCA